MASSVKSRLVEFRDKMAADLERCVDFWVKYSHDDDFGGFLNCLGTDGQVYDETKFTWFHGRQIYMYASLLKRAPDFIKDKEKVLNAAEKAAEFMMTKMKNADTNRCCLSATRDGRPIKYQRSIFSESFYTMAMLELYDVTKKEIYQKEGLSMLDKIVHWTQVDDTDLGLSKLPGQNPSSFMAVPMIVLSLGQLSLPDEKKREFKEVEEKCVKQILSHMQREGTVILENVSKTGEELPGFTGRLQNPGHAIECGWFLLEYALSVNDKDLEKIAIDKFIMNPFNSGWDEKYGGLFYFTDVDGFCPVQLEWDMKLWWPHCEALIAFLLAYQTTKDIEHMEKFQQVLDYCYTHFVDTEHGEWFGYLNRRGEVTLDFKGGPWKGCFHVPRCLMMCKQMLDNIIKEQS